MQSTGACFVQSPPELGNQFEEDTFLIGWLERVLDADVMADITPRLREMGQLAGGPLYQLQLEDRENLPRLVQWDAWGNRVDRIELTRVWRTAASLAAKYGLIAIPCERAHGAASRIHQFALVYLFHPSTDLYSCPLAMTDGAVRTLLASKNTALIERAVPRLTHRDPAQAWTSGQWMTEAIGGSDVSRTLTRAALDGEREWRLYGKKWFTSAITADMALTLARPDGHGPGAQQLALFYVETRAESGQSNGLRVERLKDKLGTRKLPTAELQLEGARAVPVCGLTHGTRHIEPMLQVTRTWNSVTAVSFMRRAIARARAYASKREAFGARLLDQPLHAETLADLEAECRGAFLLAFELVRLLGHEENGTLGDEECALLRFITPITKLLTARQCVRVISEVIECFGGAGYVEDTGIPMLLRDAQVLPIWEGTTNVLALDALLRAEPRAGLAALQRRAEHVMAQVQGHASGAFCQLAAATLHRAQTWLEQTTDRRVLQAGARECVMSIGRAFELLLLIEQSHWEGSSGRDAGALAAVRRFAAGVHQMREPDPDGAALLL